MNDTNTNINNEDAKLKSSSDNSKSEKREIKATACLGTIDRIGLMGVIVASVLTSIAILTKNND